MFPRAVRVARIRGVEVRLDPTWLVIAVLVVWSLYVRFTVPGRVGWVVVAMTVAGALGFFGSLLAHELGHAFEARHRGLRVHGVTLFLLGGVTEMDLHTHRPRDEFTVAAIGPWTSLVLGSALGLVAAGLDWYAPGVDPAAAVLGLLAWINVGLALFNIVPGSPLDGGRVLRAALWKATGDRHRAMLLAARAGQGLAILVWMLAGWVLTRPPGLLGALWVAVIGAFLFWGATAEHHQAMALRRRDRDVTADGEDGGDGDRAADRATATPEPEP